MVHGNRRNACEYAQASQDAAGLAGVDHADVLIVAPEFRAAEDIGSGDTDMLYWTEGGWKSGSNSRSDPHPRPFRIPAFEVVDELVRVARTTMPELSDVVVAGHSAGGQFVNRYAAATTVVGNAHFVVANPSSYLYFDEQRWEDETLTRPDEDQVDDCPDFNGYKYGAEDLYDYPARVGEDGLRALYRSREVTYLLGGADTDPEGSGPDRSCEAMLQGEHRLERGIQYHAYLRRMFGPEVLQRHRRVVVDDVGHDFQEMFASLVVRRVSFLPVGG